MLRRMLIALWVLSVALSAWLLPRHPIAGMCILAVAAALALWRWRTDRAMDRIVAAATRCDLDELERVARSGHQLSWYAKLVFVHHGGFEASKLRSCTCGQCEKDWMDRELDLLARRVKLAWEGSGPVVDASHGALAGGLTDCPPFWKTMAIEWRLMTMLTGRALVNEAPPPGLDLESAVEGTRWAALRWPARLALAVGANARGDRSAAQRLIEGMPTWKEGSPLERAKRELVSALGPAPPHGRIDGASKTLSGE